MNFARGFSYNHAPYVRLCSCPNVIVHGTTLFNWYSATTIIIRNAVEVDISCRSYGCDIVPTSATKVTT